jgi:hypothetical protein
MLFFRIKTRVVIKKQEKIWAILKMTRVNVCFSVQ